MKAAINWKELQKKGTFSQMEFLEASGELIRRKEQEGPSDTLQREYEQFESELASQVEEQSRKRFGSDQSQTLNRYVTSLSPQAGKKWVSTWEESLEAKAIEQVRKYFNETSTKPSSDELISSTIEQLGITDNDQKEEIATNLEGVIRNRSEKPTITTNTLGSDAKSVVIVGDNVYKVRSPGSYWPEFKAFSTKLGLADQYKPALVIDKPMVNDEVGILVVKNVDGLQNAFDQSRAIRENNVRTYGDQKFKNEEEKVRAKVNQRSRYILTIDHNERLTTLANFVKQEGAQDTYDYISHILYVAGLFQNTDAKMLPELGAKTSPTQPSYIERIKGTSNDELRDITSSSGIHWDDVKELHNETTQAVAEAAHSPTIGAVRNANFRKGYAVDLDKMRLGRAVSEYTIFLEQADLGLSQDEKPHFQRLDYIHRQSHNPLSPEQQREMENFYPFQALFENVRTLGGSQTEKKDLRNGYYRARAEFAASNLVKNLEQINKSAKLN